MFLSENECIFYVENFQLLRIHIQISGQYGFSDS